MVEKRGTKLEDLADPGKGFSTLDRKLAAALTPIVAGELMRRINNAKRALLKQDGKLFSGRQILFMVYEHFRTNKNLGLVYTIFDLSRVSWLGDDKLETFRNNWESTIAGMATDVEDAHLTELLLTQLLNSKELKEQITQFRKRDPEDPKRCYGKLIYTIYEHL